MLAGSERSSEKCGHQAPRLAEVAERGPHVGGGLLRSVFRTFQRRPAIS